MPPSNGNASAPMADRDGGLVALTTTLNTAYGTGSSVPGAGFLLNNEMDDFTAKPGAPNAYGLRQGQQNAIAPGRRPLSSMTPTLVFRGDGTPLLATGSPGGSRIITTVLQVLLNRLVHGLNLASAVAEGPSAWIMPILAVAPAPPIRPLPRPAPPLPPVDRI